MTTMLFRLSILIIAFTIVIYLNLDNSNYKLIDVSIKKPEMGWLSNGVESSCNLKFGNEIEVATEVTGRVESINATEGEFVKKGTPILQLDYTSISNSINQLSLDKDILEIELQTASIELSELNREKNRLISFIKDNYVAEVDLEKLESNIQVKINQIKTLKMQIEKNKLNQLIKRWELQKYTFEAPMDGVITELFVRKGETVIPGLRNFDSSLVFKIVDERNYKAIANVNEVDISNITVGQEVLIYPASITDDIDAFKGIVLNIDKEPQKLLNNLVYKVEIELKNIDKKLFFYGMSCRAEFLNRDTHKHGFLLPINLVKNDNKGNFVWVIRDNKSFKKYIEIGERDNFFQLTLTSLKGDFLIIGPNESLERLEDGKDVNVLD